MFGRFFTPKSSILPAPPKNQIEVVCPACGAAQYEPRLVVSTFCKKCGVHLTIKKGKVSASNATRSGVGYAEDWNAATPPPAVASARAVAANTGKTAPASATVPAPPEQEAKKPAALLPEADSDYDRGTELSAADGFGAFLKQRTQTTSAPVPAAAAPAPEQEASAKPVEQPAPVAAETSAEDPPRRAMSNSPAPTPTPAPLTASSLQKMKDLGMYRNQYFKDVECFDCAHAFKTGRSARSANCPACGAYISLEDVEINMNSTQHIKTRGDVIIRKRGHLTASELHCRDLSCQGQFETNVFCGGDARLKCSGTIIGEIRCRRLIVEKGSDIVFKNAVHAGEVEIHSRVTGAIYSTGPVLIGSNGSVNGDVTARSVSIEPGGELNGAMNIVRSKPAA